MTARLRKRVVFFTITFHPEPGALRGLPLAKALRDTFGWDVEVVTAVPWYPLGRAYPGYRIAPYQQETLDGITVHRFWLMPSHDRSALRRIVTYVSFMLSTLAIAPWKVRRAPVIFHADNLPTTGIAVAALRMLWRVRTVQHIGDLWPDSVTGSGMLGRGTLARVAESILHAVIGLVYRTDEHITVITEGFRQTLLSRGVQAEKVSVLPNWTDEERLAPVPGDAATRRRLGLDDRFMVVYAGNFGPLQGLHVVIEAATLLREDMTVQFVLIGDGPERPVLERALADSGLKNVFLLAPRPVEEMPALNAMADALLVHLRDDPFLVDTVPSKTQVAMYAGRPVIIGSAGEAARIVAAARCGFCFRPGRGDELADAVRRMAALPVEDRERMGANGQAFYHANLSLRFGAERMDALLTDVMRKGERSGVEQ